jgi:hypothetical protein
MGKLRPSEEGLNVSGIRNREKRVHSENENMEKNKF